MTYWPGDWPKRFAPCEASGVAYHNEQAGDEGRTPPRPKLDAVVPTDPFASRIVQASWIGTGLFVVTAIPAAIAPGAFVGVAVIVSLVLFGLGTGAFLWAYAIAIGRSRTDLIGMGGLFFLAGSAPAPVQRHLWASLAVELVVAVATASARIFTPLAFGILVPMFGLGVMGLWGAKFGTFPPRPPEPDRPARRARGASTRD